MATEVDSCRVDAADDAPEVVSGEVGDDSSRDREVSATVDVSGAVDSDVAACDVGNEVVLACDVGETACDEVTGCD